MIRSFIKKLVIIFLVLNVLLYSFASINEHHIDECHEENCAICKIIEVSKIITRYNLNVGICLLYSMLLCITEEILVSYINGFLVQKSLLYQKVQFNE